MAPGPVEEAGATARSFIDALKGQPAVLALSLVILIMLVFMFYALHAAGQFRETLVQRVLANSEAVHAILQQRAVNCPEK
jgi:hypothetical protein